MSPPNSRHRITVYVVVDLGYQPASIPVFASTNKHAAQEDCRERNEIISRHLRFRVYTVSTVVPR